MSNCKIKYIGDDSFRSLFNLKDLNFGATDFILPSEILNGFLSMPNLSIYSTDNIEAYRPFYKTKINLIVLPNDNELNDFFD